MRYNIISGLSGRRQTRVRIGNARGYWIRHMARKRTRIRQNTIFTSVPERHVSRIRTYNVTKSPCPRVHPKSLSRRFRSKQKVYGGGCVMVERRTCDEYLRNFSPPPPLFSRTKQWVYVAREGLFNLVRFIRNNDKKK